MGKSRDTANLISDDNIFVDIVNDRVGIATTTPQYKLDVRGDINFSGSLNQGGSSFVASRWTAGTGNDIYRLNGNVGIGTTNPTSKLQVVGDALVSGIVTATSVVVGSAVTINSSGINAIGIVTATSVVVGSAVTINSSGINAIGIVTATSYRGDGSQLSGISVGNDITSCLFT